MRALNIGDYRTFLEQPDWWIYEAVPKFLDIEARAQEIKQKKVELRAKVKSKASKR